MDTTWILVADSGRARIFEKHNHAAITELQDLTNSLGRLQDRELKTDKEGRFFGHPAQGNTSEPEVPPEAHQALLFAETIDKFLSDSYHHQRFSKLQLIVPPEFLGLLRKKLDDQVRKVVVKEVPKDLSRASVKDIQHYVS